MKTFIALIISVANYARDVLGRFSTITSSVSSVQSVVSSFAYANDELGRRTQRLDILPAAPFALTNTFGYNVRSEVVAAIMGANDHAYAYDPIGDLLAADLDGEGVFYSYDTNSNVTDLVDTKGDSVAHYEYGPFGETAAQKGSLVEVNPFHFSTKDLDVRVGLYFYGYRFLNPELGRWLNRDPIGEEGGVHLYSMVVNDPLGKGDYLGLMNIGPDPGAGIIQPSPPTSGECGSVDVTALVRNVLMQIEAEYKKITDVCCRKAHCDTLYGLSSQGAWDIQLLAVAGNPNVTWPWRGHSGGAGGCERTVIYDGQCVPANAVNYAMWGKINSLCGFSSARAAGTAYARKKAFYGGSYAREAAAWTRFGYSGRLSGGGVYQHCKVPKSSHSPSNSTWVWSSGNNPPANCPVLYGGR